LKTETVEVLKVIKDELKNLFGVAAAEAEL